MRTIVFDNTSIINDKKFTALTEDIAAGVSSLPMQSITGFAINQILLIGELGSENTEIILTHAATAPTGTTITLASNTIYPHTRATKILLLDYNQVEISWSATATGIKTVLDTIALQSDQVKTIYNDLVESTGYYFKRLKNSIGSTFSGYYDPEPFAGFSEDQIGSILDFVQNKLKHDWDDRFSRKTAMQEATYCLRYMQGKLKHWSKYLVANYAIGQTARGIFDWALPLDIYDENTNKSILQIKTGSSDVPLVPLDEKEFDFQMGDCVKTEVRTQALSGDITLEINNSYDLEDSGSVDVFVSNIQYTITYTGVTRSATTGILTGIPASGDGSISITIPVDTNVWQNEVEGQPECFNVRQGRIRVWPIPSSSWINKNILGDYYKEATTVDSEADTIDTARIDAVKEWLLWKGDSYWKNNGKDDLQNANFLIFQDILKSAIRTEVSGQKFHMKPKVNSIDYKTRRQGKNFSQT